MKQAKKTKLFEGDGVNGYALPFLTPVPFLATLGIFPRVAFHFGTWLAYKRA
tara:strand:- start:511 stop:666 length:156 start_codon:yes stop_codon:yes gene_type:complete